MTAVSAIPDITIRQRVAARTPPGLRKAVRMALNYVYRIRTWIKILGQVRPVGMHSRKVMWKSAASALATSFRNLDSFQQPAALGDMTVEVFPIGRFSIRAATDDLLHVMPWRERKVREVCEATLGPGGTFVDGGANIGFYSVLAARKVGREGKVVAVEMMPDTAAILRGHIADNELQQVEIFQCALSNRRGQVEASVAQGRHGQASIMARQAGGRSVRSVDAFPLDEVLTKVGPVDLIKLDLEGAELLALQGATKVLARTSCVVFESNEMDQRIFDLLVKAGFTIELLEGSDFVARKAAQ